MKKIQKLKARKKDCLSHPQHTDEKYVTYHLRDYIIHVFIFYF